MTEHAISNQRPLSTSSSDFCLHCQKLIGPPPDFSQEVKDKEGNVVGRVHRAGPCREEWLKGHSTHTT